MALHKGEEILAEASTFHVLFLHGRCAHAMFSDANQRDSAGYR